MTTNVLVKPNDQSQTCLSFGMARKRRMKSNIMFLRDMKIMMMRDVNIKQGLAKAMLLTLLFLGGDTRPCGTLCLQSNGE